MLASCKVKKQKQRRFLFSDSGSNVTVVLSYFVAPGLWSFKNILSRLISARTAMGGQCTT